MPGSARLFLPALRIESVPIPNPVTPVAAPAAEPGRGFGGFGLPLAFLFPQPTSKASHPEDESGIEFRKFTIWNYL